MALRARVAPVLPLLWLTGVWRCLCGWIACCAIVAHRGCNMDWIGNISKWALWTVETLGWESNCFVARGGRGVELVVSRAAIWSTCCSCFSCCSWWLHRSVLGCRAGCHAAHATWSFKRHAGIACERVACNVVMSAGGTAAAPSCRVHDYEGCWLAAPVSNPACVRKALAGRWSCQCPEMRWLSMATTRGMGEVAMSVGGTAAACALSCQVHGPRVAG